MDESFLNTGMTSPAYRESVAKRDEQRREKDHLRGKLTPAAELINELIEAEKTKVCDIRSFVVDAKSPDEELKSVLLAKHMHLNFLNSFKTAIENKLREPKKNG